ncbi:MAG: hypothetical protein HY868_25725 [Chloroflexi bacterium]|nr:hypothetical protein [Chloroflexota bacterium]
MKKLVLVVTILFAMGFAFFPQQQTGTLTKQIAASADDVNEDGTTFDATSKNMWIGNVQSTTNSYTGFRFTGTTIPKGVTITSARLEVYSIRDQWIPVGFLFAAEAADNPTAFSASSRPSQRTLTTQRVDIHNDVSWNQGTWYTFDVIPVVQEIVNRPGWQSGNAINMIVKGTGGAWGAKSIASYDLAPANAARLVVSYSSGGTPVATATATRTNTPMPTATGVLPTATRTNTPMPTATGVLPTATRTSTPIPPGTAAPTPTQVLVPSIMLNSVPPQALPVGLLTIRVRNAAGVYLNGVGVKFQSCIAPGAGACTAYEGDTTLVTFNRFNSDGIIHLAVNCDTWYRLTLGTVVRDVYFSPTTGYQYVEFVQ